MGIFVFFFKQKTAYEMRISDWSSDVCSSDLGTIRATGKLGDVMQESIQAAFSFVKARAPAYGIKPSLLARKDVHVHMPEGAVPKDGPSAGVAMVTSIIYTLSGIPVRKDVVMTGEVKLRGRVRAMGGLRERTRGGWGKRWGGAG